MKRLIIGLIVAGATLAINSYALTRRPVRIFYLDGETDTYYQAPLEGKSCALYVPSPGCTLFFEGFFLPDGPFTSDNIPYDVWYTVTPIDVNQTYQ